MINKKFLKNLCLQCGWASYIVTLLFPTVAKTVGWSGPRWWFTLTPKIGCPWSSLRNPTHLYCNLELRPVEWCPLRLFFRPLLVEVPVELLPWTVGPPPNGVSLLDVASETDVEPIDEVSSTSRSSNSSENSSSSSESLAYRQQQINQNEKKNIPIFNWCF